MHLPLGIPLLPRDRCTHESHRQVVSAFVCLFNRSEVTDTDDNRSAIDPDLQSTRFGSALDACIHRLPCKWQSRYRLANHGLGVGSDRPAHWVSYFRKIPTHQSSRQIKQEVSPD